MTLSIDSQPRPPRARRFTRREFQRLAAEGFFDNQRVELLDGEIIEMAPQIEPHVGMISRLIRLLAPSLPLDLELRCQAPLSIGDSAPEPDIAIIRVHGQLDDAPQSALLVIEVADSSLAIDRKKSHLYASANIPEYWIINLVERHIERFSSPERDGSSPFGFHYATAALTARDEIEVAIFPMSPMAVASIFP